MQAPVNGEKCALCGQEFPAASLASRLVTGGMNVVAGFLIFAAVIEFKMTPEERVAREKTRAAESAQPRAQAAAPTPRPADVGAGAIAVDPGALVAAYEANELAADARYKGQRLRVGGTLHSIGRDILGSAYVTIESGNPIRKVQATLSRLSADRAQSLAKGAYVSVVGECSGLMMNVQLKDADIER